MHSRERLLHAAVLAALFGAAPTLAAPPSTSAYVTDPQHSHVEDATSRGVQQVNMITCIMQAMRPDALVNDGAYIALVDETKCDPRARASSGGAAGSQTGSYLTATVNSTRASNSEPMRVRTWIAVEEEGTESTIFVNTSASGAPSTEAPYGAFRLDYCGRGGDSPACMMRGYMEAANSGLSYYEQENGEHGEGSVALRLSSVGTSSGSGRMRLDHGSEQLEFTFAYDQSHFRRADDSGDQCFSRDASDPDTGQSVWRYGLYDESTGERVTRNSGFPIEYTHNSRTYHGYLSYWGLSLPPEAAETLSNGATVQRVDYSNGEEPTRTNYSLVRGEGKLLKHTKQTRTLAAIDKIRINTWIGDVTGFFAGATPNAQYVLYWDDAADVFKVVGRMECGEGPCQVQDFETEQSVAHTFWSGSGGMGGVRGWSESLGGEVFIDLRAVSGAIDAANINVIYRKQDIIYPSQMPTSLHCLRDCPTAATLAAYFAEGSASQSPFVAGTFNRFGPTTEAVVYSTDASNAALEDAVGEPVTFTDREALQQRGQYRSGVRTGRLFATLSDAVCPDNASAYCESQVDALDVFYTWETGPEHWNQFAAVKNASGDFVIFDAPLQLTYQVPAGAAYGDYAGKSIVLQYGGFGDLWGVPGHCVSRLTNEAVSCDTEESRYVPAFIIPFDATAGRAMAGDSGYLIKWLEREIRFARKSQAVCASLPLPSEVTLPTSAVLKDPSDAASDIYIGTKPSVTDAPRVIHGEVKF